jgi:hypothetical protein
MKWKTCSVEAGAGISKRDPRIRDSESDSSREESLKLGFRVFALVGCKKTG